MSRLPSRKPTTARRPLGLRTVDQGRIEADRGHGACLNSTGPASVLSTQLAIVEGRDGAEQFVAVVEQHPVAAAGRIEDAIEQLVAGGSIVRAAEK